jgi:dolichol-phosphate mannosyltransferase
MQSKMSATYWIILPTYCEAENLPVILDRLRFHDRSVNILVVDDNSPDGTADIAETIGEQRGDVHVLRRRAKVGLGAAYLAGFRRVLDEGADFVVTMDSDLSHSPEALPVLMTASENAGCVVGSRYVAGGSIVNWPLRRRALSAAANYFVRVLFNMPVSDCTSGYRVYRRQVVNEILRRPPTSQGYSFLVEALKIAVAGPMPVIESPICFVERVSGTSKMGLREIVEGAVRLLALRWTSSLTPRDTQPDNEDEKGRLDYT